MGELIEHLKPNFFIPGAAKSGTTTLHDMLNTHPEISMSSVKEPGYWKNKNFKEFGNTEMHNYQNLFDNTKKFKGESSTAYMYYDSFINNVKNNYKEPPKFIFILRNPIDRYFSHVNWMKGLGLEKNNLDEIINNEETLETLSNSLKQWPYKIKNYDLKEIISEGRKYSISKSINLNKKGSEFYLSNGKDNVLVPKEFTILTQFIFQQEFFTYKSIVSNFPNIPEKNIQDCINQLKNMKVII